LATIYAKPTIEKLADALELAGANDESRVREMEALARIEQLIADLG
jgi:endonuclease V-like protein UPF0215 family